MPDPRRDAAVATAGNLAQTPHAWIARLVAAGLEGAADVVAELDAGWDELRPVVVVAMRDALSHVPEMERAEAAAIARGVGAVVTWVRRVAGR